MSSCIFWTRCSIKRWFIRLIATNFSFLLLRIFHFNFLSIMLPSHLSKSIFSCLKNISTFHPVAVAELVRKGKKFLEIIRGLFEADLENLLLYWLLFTLILVLLWPKSTLYLAYCPIIGLNTYYLSLVKYAIQNIVWEVGRHYYMAWRSFARRIWNTAFLAFDFAFRWLLPYRDNIVALQIPPTALANSQKR